MVAGASAIKSVCYHCGLPVVTGEQFCAEINQQMHNFCCPACKVIATTISESGLGQYYQYREQHFSQSPENGFVDESNTASAISALESDFTVFDDEQFLQRYVDIQNNTVTATLLIGGMHCVACSWLLENFLGELKGVHQVSVNLSEQTVTLSWEKDQQVLSVIAQAIASLGYQVEPYSVDALHSLRQQENKQSLRRLGVAGIAMMQAGMFAIAMYADVLNDMSTDVRDLLRWVSLLITLPVVFYSAQPFFFGAWRGLAAGRSGMDLPVALAIGLAFFASVKATLNGDGEVYFDSVAMFTFLLLGGRYLEMRARHYGSRLSSNLNSLLPSTAIVMTGQTLKATPLFNVKKNDLLLIKAGAIIPADGIVVEGESAVNESQLSGEFLLQSKSVGDQLIAGTVNGAANLTMQVQATGAELQLQAINTLVQQAQTHKPKIAKLADRYASTFVSLVIALSVSTYVYWHWQGSNDAFWIMLSVLVVSCPCALSLATPTALMAATNRLRQLGLLVTKGDVWEKIPTITDVVCDKTGTLTKGELTITDVKLGLTNNLLSENQIIAIASALESRSEHPLAKAFAQKSLELKQESLPQVEQFEIVVGKGIEGVIDNKRYRIGSYSYISQWFDVGVDVSQEAFQQTVLLANTDGVIATFELQDQLREDAAELIQQLKSEGIVVHLLSGDSSGAAQLLSKQLMLDYCQSGVTPEEKLNYIQGLQRSGKKVLMIGDGINDVPVLAAADVSVAMGNASNLAKTHADSVVLSSRLIVVAYMLSLAADCKKVIWQNLAWALSYNLLAIPLAAMAMIPPWLAAIGMSVSSLIVVINALRLQRFNIDAKKHSINVPLLAEATV
jgi:Cu2+-exporting ATPase